MFNSLYENIIEGRSVSNVNLGPIITAGAYSAADAVGGLLIFNGASKQRGGSGRILGMTVVDYGQVKAALKLFLYDRPFTAVADNAAFDVSNADAKHLVGVIATSTYGDIGSSNSYYTAALTAIAYRCFNSRALYGQLVCTATPTYASTSGLTVKLHVDIVN